MSVLGQPTLPLHVTWLSMFSLQQPASFPQLFCLLGAMGWRWGCFIIGCTWMEAAAQVATCVCLWCLQHASECKMQEEHTYSAEKKMHLQDVAAA